MKKQIRLKYDHLTFYNIYYEVSDLSVLDTGRNGTGMSSYYVENKKRPGMSVTDRLRDEGTVLSYCMYYVMTQDLLLSTIIILERGAIQRQPVKNTRGICSSLHPQGGEQVDEETCRAIPALFAGAAHEGSDDSKIVVNTFFRHGLEGRMDVPQRSTGTVSKREGWSHG